MFASSLNAEIPYLSAQSLASIFYSQFDFFEFHSQSFFARRGELRENPLNNGVWLNEGFGFLNHREGEYVAKVKTSYNYLSLGYDTSFAFSERSLYFGGVLGFINAHSQASLFDGKKEGYALGAYFSYIQQNRFFFDVSMKYFYKTQTIFFKDPFLSDSLYGDGGNGVHFVFDVGHRIGVSPILSGSVFFLEPSMMLEMGYLPKQTFKLQSQIQGIMRGFFPLRIKANLAFGREWNSRYKGSLKGGVALEYDDQVNGAISLRDESSFLYLEKRDDFRVGLFLEADFILDQNLRFFMRSRSTFLGKINTDYAMNLGVRLSFGPLIMHGLHSKKSIDWTEEKLQ